MSGPTKAELSRDLITARSQLSAANRAIDERELKLLDIAKAVIKEGRANELCNDGLQSFVEEHFGLDVVKRVVPEYVIELRLTAAGTESFDDLCENLMNALNENRYTFLNGSAADIVEVTDSSWFTAEQHAAYCKRVAS